MPRINVMAERKIMDNRYAELNLPDKETGVERVWRRRSILTQEIYAFEEINDKMLLIEMQSGETFRVKESYDQLDGLLFDVEEAPFIEFQLEQDEELSQQQEGDNG